ncbi:hypothetical protein ASC95_17490 [Pelomonas sp. Root1217]|uniref:PEP-CTERM sorting domain-containing protein n=1 Tax=Pelomonas sp. Root1217 TaxID=1736430 RepID=UPI00070E7BE9|nr:PEP-CTERM sorting domain-containing protein [Pelomonas sp. Root1217]KQV49394.1 hypothetical protein ASC95_17490 [Pelomonas sp. Root1217]
MKAQKSRWIALSALVAGLGLASSAQAYWGLDTTPTNTIGDSGNAAYTVKMSGFYASNDVNNKVNGNWTSNALTQFAGNGQGMYTGTDNGSPYHALDNNQNTEAVLLSFSASTVLSSVGLGFTSNVEISCKNTTTQAMTYQNGGTCGAGTTQVGTGLVDVSVFRWTGAAAPTLTGAAAGTMAGWELVGNYGDMVQDTSNPYNQVNTAGKTSSWWLISAYNSGFAQTAGGANSIATENRATLTNGDDFFKLYAVAGTKCTQAVDSKGVCGGTNLKLPEPASLALTSVALVGVAGLRRRKAKLTA